MMMRMHRVNGILAAFIAALALAACGPGGPRQDTGAGSNATPATGVAGQDSNAPTLTNDVAADGRAWINYRRSQVGMSALAENPQIDLAAQGHSNYQSVNNTVTHVQTAGKQGFTGAQLQDRLANAGYVIDTNAHNAIGEVISASTSKSGFFMAEQLITAIYHRIVIFEPVFKEIGSGSSTDSKGYTYFTADFAANNGYGPGLAAGTVATWPFSGQIDVPADFLSDQEEPDPVPDKGVNDVGYPVSVHANLTSKLTVQSFTIRAHGSNTDLSTRLLSQATDANVTSPAAAIIPLSPLAKGSTYDVSFSGTVDGVPVNKTWSFTTAK